jgi:hypothetical protein
MPSGAFDQRAVHRNHGNAGGSRSGRPRGGGIGSAISAASRLDAIGPEHRQDDVELGAMDEGAASRTDGTPDVAACITPLVGWRVLPDLGSGPSRCLGNRDTGHVVVPWIRIKDEAQGIGALRCRRDFAIDVLGVVAVGRDGFRTAHEARPDRQLSWR